MILRKIKKIKPLIDIKKRKLDNELKKLASLNQDLNENNKLLQLRQEQYLKSSQELNQKFSNEKRHGFEIASAGVDYLREEWSYLFRNRKKIEKEIQSQSHMIKIAHDQLDNIKKLHNKYLQVWHDEVRKKDLEELNENSLSFSLKREEGI